MGSVRIGIPVAHYHPGTTGEYAARALLQLGHEVSILSAAEFISSSHTDQYQFYFCVDSGEPLDLSDPALDGDVLKRTAFWFIDFRHNKHRSTRSPTDFETASALDQGGGWIFQSQFQDEEYCRENGLSRVSWLPLGADPEVWNDAPAAPVRFHLGFSGNVWDEARKRALEILMNTRGLRFAFQGHGKVWKEEAAALLRSCAAGFNINSYFDEPFAYDLNMRVFETLSCGVPIITNEVPALSRVFPPEAPYIRTYRSINEILPVVVEALGDCVFRGSGTAAREFVVNFGTYRHRMEKALEVVSKMP